MMNGAIDVAGNSRVGVFMIARGPYPAIHNLETAGDTSPRTVSRELSKDRSKFDDAGAEAGRF